MPEARNRQKGRPNGRTLAIVSRDLPRGQRRMLLLDQAMTTALIGCTSPGCMQGEPPQPCRWCNLLILSALAQAAQL
jgi:hypothetical protein